MKIITKMVLALLMVGAFGYAQNQHPSKTVNNLKQAGITFQEINLFSQTTLKKSGVKLPEEVTDYDLFSLDVQQMASLKSLAPETMSMVIPGKKSPLTLELVKSELFADGFKITEMPSGRDITSVNQNIHYRGIIKDNEHSIAAISIFNGEISGIISEEGGFGNLILGKLENSTHHILYEDVQIAQFNNSVCNSPEGDDLKQYTYEQLNYVSTNKAATKCPEIFFDIASDIVNDKGGSTQASNYVTAVFNQVSVLYANDDITIKLGGIKVWTGNTPFANNLDSYTAYRENNSFNGDLAHFVTYNYSGGIAWRGGLCNSYSAGISGIRKTFSNVPTYSWSVEVVAHELGHNLGSRHTHDCAWNGNNTQIDFCGNQYLETTSACGNAGIPSQGGTIMSYCHLTNVGINFTLGFGAQPKSVIQSYIAGRSCVQTCDDGSGGCTNGDAVTATFTNSTNCTIEYFWNNNGNLMSYGQLAAGQSKNQGTFVGHSWVVNQTDGSQLDSFTISCNTTNYITSGTCNNGDKCAGVAAWSSSISYPLGAKVTYFGNLFERVSGGWLNLGACGSPLAEGLADAKTALVPPTFEINPNPASNILNIDITGLNAENTAMSILDINGRVLKTITLNKTPEGKVNSSVNVSDLKSGIYFLKVKGNNFPMVQKLIIK